jgi:hypothetical protein
MAIASIKHRRPGTSSPDQKAGGSSSSERGWAAGANSFGRYTDLNAVPADSGPVWEQACRGLMTNAGSATCPHRPIAHHPPAACRPTATSHSRRAITG